MTYGQSLSARQHQRRLELEIEVHAKTAMVAYLKGEYFSVLDRNFTLAKENAMLRRQVQNLLEKSA